jgi:hypothetical protein
MGFIESMGFILVFHIEDLFFKGVGELLAG